MIEKPLGEKPLGEKHPGEKPLGEKHPGEKLLDAPPQVVNIGLSGFADDLRKRGVPVVHVDWSPPAGGNPRLRDLLSRLKS